MKRREEKTERSAGDLLQNNPSVSPSVVEAYEKLERQLSKLGVKVERRYGIEHPLGSDRNKFSVSGLERGYSLNQRS